MNVLLVYPNLPLMMAPAISMGLFNAILKRENCNVKLFETTQYSEEYNNRHIRMTEIGANRPNKDDEVKDMFFIKSPESIIPDFVECVKTFSPDLIVMSVQEDTWKTGSLLLDSIADLNIPHLIGGVFPTNAPDRMFENPNVKVIALHEGENILIDAVNNLKNNKPLTEIRGIRWRNSNGNIIKNPPAQLCNISETIPDFDCFNGNRWQRPMGGKIFKNAVSMETYRGCPYNCTYCNSPTTRIMSKDFGVGNFMRRKSADVVEKELLYYKEKYDPDLIMFIDDSFLARPAKEIYEFCDMWSKYKIPFWFNTRVENCKPEYLAALKEAGVYRMTFGLESGNEEYRRNILKRTPPNETYYEYFDYINQSNIPYSLNVIIGMPFETRDMVLDTAKMVNRARGYDGLTISMFQPYYGTELRTMAVENGFLDSTHINGWNSTSMGGGYLDSWQLRMPQPYLQLNDVEQLTKTFALYAHFGEERWEEIHQAETNDIIYKKLFSEYQAEFFGDIQQGGLDRIHTYCAKHDATATYNFSEIKK